MKPERGISDPPARTVETDRILFAGFGFEALFSFCYCFVEHGFLCGG